MSWLVRRPAPPRGLARVLDDERFIRGLGLGALIGAAIGGSTLWNRRREAARPDDRDAEARSREGPPATR
jgi:hypothetical protein